MKKLLLICLLLVCISINAFAGEKYISVSYFAFNGDDTNSKNNLPMAAIEAGYAFNKYLETGIELASFKYKSDWGSSFRDISLITTIKLKYPWHRFTPYLVAGIGNRRFTAVHMIGYGGAPAERISAKQSIALKYGLGVEYYLQKNCCVFAESTYRYGDTGRQATLDDWGWSWGGGLKYYF